MIKNMLILGKIWSYCFLLVIMFVLCNIILYCILGVLYVLIVFKLEYDMICNKINFNWIDKIYSII